MPRRTDIWRPGIARRPIAQVIASGSLGEDIVWLPEDGPFRFLADPFGWPDAAGRLHVFAERYDYRIRHGTIDALVFDTDLSLLDRRPCLTEPWHLSYPQVFAGEGETWMLPEAHRSGGLTLYRDHGGLADWRAECRLALDCVPVDASIVHHEGRWWLFYSPGTSKAAKVSHLHVAWADKLCGPWTVHPGNPVRIDRRSARPGGTPVVIDGRIMLPVQDCTQTYGGGLRPLWIDRLDETGFSAEAGAQLPIPGAAGPYRDGLHTLAACGDLTLFDVKRIDRSLGGLLIDLKRKLGAYS